MQLHKRDVVEAATALLDNYGIADLTMRRLARELDVSPGALYWHFANKQQLLGAIADRILEPVDDVPAAWRDRITGICGRLRDALLSHTDGAELVSASFAAGQSRGDGTAGGAARRRGGRGRRRPRARRAGRPHGRSTTCWGSPPTNSPGCSGTPRAPSCPTSSRCWPTTRVHGSVRAVDLLVDGIGVAETLAWKVRAQCALTRISRRSDMITVDDVRAHHLVAAQVLRGGRARPDQVPGGPDRLRRVLARRDGDGCRLSRKRSGRRWWPQSPTSSCCRASPI